MLALAADENFNNDIIRGMLRRRPDLNIVRVQDVGLSGASDSTVLEWAAAEGRVLLTHDVSTITQHAYERSSAGLPMPGVFQVAREVPIGVAIEDIILLAEYSHDGEWAGQVRYLPLR
jgi:hypothetical protein